MKQLDPNVLLALTTLSALLLLITTATLFGTPEPWWRYLATGVVVVAAYLAMNRFIGGWFSSNQPPLIVPEAPKTAAWAATFPLLILIASAAPLVWPGLDYGLAVIIAGIWFGLTIRSALKSVKSG